jgi:hypothetical protein
MAHEGGVNKPSKNNRDKGTKKRTVSLTKGGPTHFKKGTMTKLTTSTDNKYFTKYTYRLQYITPCSTIKINK